MSIDRDGIDKLLQNKKGGTHTRCSLVMAQCLWEKIVQGYGGVLVQDSSSIITDSGIKPTFYIRVYRFKIDGEFINTWIKFTYWERDDLADIDVSFKDLTVFDKVCQSKDLLDEQEKVVEW
jgi:hypothetical protein